LLALGVGVRESEENVRGKNFRPETFLSMNIPRRNGEEEIENKKENFPNALRPF
jgi:hypothetical protein